MGRKPGKINRQLCAVHSQGLQDREEVGQRSWNGWCWKMLMVPGPHRWPGLSGQKPVGIGQE